MATPGSTLRSGRATVLGAALVSVLAVAGCTTGAPARPPAAGAEQRFVAGDGSIRQLAVSERKPARDVDGTTLTGKQLRLADLRGKVVVVNAWASWCGPCREEAPGLQRAWQDLQGKDVRFVGLNEKDDDPPAQAFVRRFGLTYPSIVDPEGLHILAFRDVLPPIATPSTLVLDRQGRVAARVVGQVSEVTVRDLVEDVLVEPS